MNDTWHLNIQNNYLERFKYSGHGFFFLFFEGGHTDKRVYEAPQGRYGMVYYFPLHFWRGGGGKRVTKYRTLEYFILFFILLLSN